MAVKRRVPVGAHYGLRDWLVQRASAVVMVIASLILTIAFIVVQPDSYAEWRDFIRSGGIRLLLMVIVIALAWHAFIGARDIFMDYIKHDMLRLLKIVGIVVYLVTCVLWAAAILL